MISMDAAGLVALPYVMANSVGGAELGHCATPQLILDTKPCL